MTTHNTATKALNSEIRYKVNGNNFRLYHELKNDQTKWHALCTAMDIVADMDLAFNSYRTIFIRATEQNHGLLYLATYGLMECFVQQQNAILTIDKQVFGFESLNFKNDEQYPNLKEIRELRDSITAHPTFNNPIKGSQLQQTTSINRSTSSFSSLCTTQSHSESPDEPAQYTDKQVDLIGLFEKQKNEAIKAIEQIGAKMNEKENEHRKKHSDEKLEATFSSVAYYCQKLNENPASFSFNLQNIKDCANKFKTQLENRGENEIIACILHQITFFNDACAQLEAQLAMQQQNTILIKILANFIFLKLDELTSEAKNVDTKYST